MPIILAATLLVFEVLLVIVHLTVYATLAFAFGIGGTWLKVVFIILAFTFVSASVLSHFYKGKFVDLYYSFSAYWFGLVHFLFVGSLIFYFTLDIFYRQNIYVAPALAGAGAFGAAFLIHLYGTIQSQRPTVTRVRVALSEVAAGFDKDFWKDKRAVFVSDFQLGNIYRERFTARVTDKINALDPYVVFIGGDLYDGVVCDEKRLIAPLRELRALHTPAHGGVYFITGNHEYYLPNVPRAMEAVREFGITVLDNKKVTIGGIDVIGIDYQTTHKRDDLKKVLAGINIDASRPSILLKHEPRDLDVAAEAGISFDISGHTHHGQIFPLMFFTHQMYKGFDYGLKRLKKMWVFTSSGVGTWGTPLRLGTRAEIVEMEFV